MSTYLSLPELAGTLLAEEFFRVPDDPVRAARAAVDALTFARECLKTAGAPRALERTKFAISSAKGAVRHAENKAAR